MQGFNHSSREEIRPGHPHLLYTIIIPWRGISAPCLSRVTPGDQHQPSQDREREALSNPRTICWLRTDQSAAALRWRLQIHPGVLLAQHWMQPGAPQGAAQPEIGAEPCYTQLLCLRQQSLRANPSHRAPKSRLRSRLGLLAPQAEE